MVYNPEIHHRRSIRLKNYEYSQAGLYFVTICAQNRECLFGKIVNGEMSLNEAGRMINQTWLDIPKQHVNTKLHGFVIMPNHFHGLIEIIVGAESISARSSFEKPLFSRSQYQRSVLLGQNRADMESAPTGVDGGESITLGLSDVVQTFKRFTTIKYMQMVKQNLLPSFDKKIWQRNYYEHIVRDESDFQEIEEYIKNNPQKWELDKENPNQLS